uniref:SPRY domain-containing protein n=1 Tax=Meloidogyne incognita TaxID=6306 RepID=A0A914MU86_MELIC
MKEIPNYDKIIKIQTKFDNLLTEFNQEKEKNEREKKLVEDKHKKAMKILEKKMNEEIQKLKSEHENEVKDVKEYFQQLIDEKIEEIKTEEKQKIGECSSEIKKLGNIGVNFIRIKNKWSSIENKCCSNGCINKQKPVGTCIKGNGFANLIDEENIKYIVGEGENKSAVVAAENKFKNPKEEINYSLFYFEIKCKIEGEKNNNVVVIGVNNGKYGISLYIDGAVIACGQSTKIKLPESFSWNDGDIFGCGVVYPPTSVNKLPYVFFTQNGKQIGKGLLLKDNKQDNYEPFVVLKRYHLEANFGNDLKNKPFTYDISQHSVIDEFYGDDSNSSDDSDSDDSDSGTMRQMMQMMVAGAMAKMFIS